MNIIYLILILALIIAFGKNIIKEGYNDTSHDNYVSSPTVIPLWMLNNWGYYDPYRFGKTYFPYYRRHIGRYPYHRFGYYS